MVRSPTTPIYIAIGTLGLAVGIGTGADPGTVPGTEPVSGAVVDVAMISPNISPNTGTGELASELVPLVLTVGSLELGPLLAITLVSSCLILDVNRDFGDN